MIWFIWNQESQSGVFIVQNIGKFGTRSKGFFSSVVLPANIASLMGLRINRWRKDFSINFSIIPVSSIFFQTNFLLASLCEPLLHFQMYEQNQ